MLASFLAILMATVSLILFLNAFISPKTHRQDDFLWSALGFFYALVLWLCAGRFTGAVLLGQMAGVFITVAFLWENRQLRKAITTNSESNEILEGFSVLNFVADSVGKISLRKKAVEKVKSPESIATSTTESQEQPTKSVDETSNLETEAKAKAEETEKTTTAIENDTQTSDSDGSESAESEIETSEEKATVSEEEITTETESNDDDDIFSSSLSDQMITPENKPSLWQKITGFFKKSSSESITKVAKSSVSELDQKSDNDEFDLDSTTNDTEIKTTIDEVIEETNTNASELEQVESEEAKAEITPEKSVVEEVAEIEEKPTPPEEDISEETASNYTDTNSVVVETIEAEVEEGKQEVVPDKDTEENQDIEAEISSTITAKTDKVGEQKENSPTKEEAPEEDIIQSLSDLFDEPDETKEDK